MKKSITLALKYRREQIRERVCLLKTAASNTKKRFSLIAKYDKKHYSQPTVYGYSREITHSLKSVIAQLDLCRNTEKST